MIISNLKACCYECPCPDIRVDNREIYNLAQSDVCCTIYCHHNEVCKTYLEFNNTKLTEEESECKM